ncbi:putative ACR [Fragilaria crotonensis]|nr:putative ACR [Fragilaria crotonensis]
MNAKSSDIVGTGVSRTEVVPLPTAGNAPYEAPSRFCGCIATSAVKSDRAKTEFTSVQQMKYRSLLEKAWPDLKISSSLAVDPCGIGGLARGLQDEVRLGKYEVIPPQRTPEVWRMLLMQDVLSKVNLLQKLAIAGKAWSRGGDVNSKDDKDEIPIGGLGENFDEEDDTLVFKSDVKVSDLSDKALRSWVATFLLGSPWLGES